MSLYHAHQLLLTVIWRNALESLQTTDQTIKEKLQDVNNAKPNDAAILRQRATRRDSESQISTQPSTSSYLEKADTTLDGSYASYQRTVPGYTGHDIHLSIDDTVQQLRSAIHDLEAQRRNEESDASSTTTGPRRGLWRCICWHMYACIFTCTTASLVFGLVWTIVHHDISGAFTVSGYIITLGALLVGVLMAKHGEECVKRSGNG